MTRTWTVYKITTVNDREYKLGLYLNQDPGEEQALYSMSGKAWLRVTDNSGKKCLVREKFIVSIRRLENWEA